MKSKRGILPGVLAIMLIVTVTAAGAAEGLISVASSHNAVDTMNKFESILKSKGMKIFARIDHSKGAESVGIAIRPTELIVFGNPKVGSPLMKCAPTVALDLPQKAVVWVDEADQVWLSYNDPQFLKTRHDISGCDAVLEKVGKALAGMTKAATSDR